MPTYRQRSFISTALESLLAQTYDDWELVVVDDGSPDETADVIKRYARDERISYLRNDVNRGLGASLNTATEVARGRYISYLPSDDLYYTDHLESLVALLDQEPATYLAYGGVQCGYSPTYEDSDWLHAATLQGDDVVGREADALLNRRPGVWRSTRKSGNILALVQVMHRRDLESRCKWTPRWEKVSDDLEADYWSDLARLGAQFSYVGRVTCQWVQHPHQRHRIIGGRLNEFNRMVGGLAMYRSYYGIPAGEYLNWQPALGFNVDERKRSESVSRRYARPAGGSSAARGRLRILVVGDLGFNPERLLLFEHAGHELAGLWLKAPQVWLSTGPFPWGNIKDFDVAGPWRQQVAEFAPDIIYAGLNWLSIPLISEVLDSGYGVPLVFHFKEAAAYARRFGLWPDLLRILTGSQGQIFINEESREWFRQITGGAVGDVPGSYLIMDADLAPAEWFSTDFRSKLSDRDGEPHTVSAGGWVWSPESWLQLAEARIHVHVYGEVFGNEVPDEALDTCYVHRHPGVLPADWVAELSQYDAGWLHIFRSHNRGNLLEATWNDLNYPGRLSTYAAAGLPWIMWNNQASGATTAVENLARSCGVGIFIQSVDELAEQLSDRTGLRERSANMRHHRDRFTFDSRFDELLEFFRQIIGSCRHR